MKFKTRTKGTSRQIGKKFPIIERKRLPKIVYPIKYTKPPTNVAITYLDERGVKKVVVLELSETVAFYQDVRSKGYTVIKTEKLRSSGGKARHRKSQSEIDLEKLDLRISELQSMLHHYKAVYSDKDKFEKIAKTDSDLQRAYTQRDTLIRKHRMPPEFGDRGYDQTTFPSKRKPHIQSFIIRPLKYGQLRYGNEFNIGVKVEMEHTKDKKVAARIAIDHLREDPRYYTKHRKCFPGEH